MSTNRSIRKSLPYFNAGSPSDSMFYNYSPTLSLTQHQASTRSPLAEEKEVRSPDFVWEAEYQDKMTVLEKSIAQVPSSEKRQINFQFIDDMKATFDFNTMHSKRKRPTDKQITADNKSSARKDRKAAVKLPDLTKKRRPRNAFILYRTVLQAKAEFKGKTQTELSRLIAACWQNEPPETRARFERAAELEKTFGYGATDVFNIKVGPPEKEWDSETTDAEQGSHPQTASKFEDVTSPYMPSESEYAQTMNYPMYVPPFSPSFDQNQQDPYQVQASFQMLGSPYTDSPVYAGTPCGQINLSPQQSMFPFNAYQLDSTPDQSTPMSPAEFDQTSASYFPTSLEQSSTQMTPAESFALHSSPVEVADIPTDYSLVPPLDLSLARPSQNAAFDNYRMDYNHNAPPPSTQTMNSGYPNNISHQETYQTYNTGNNEMYSQAYHHTSHHSVEDNSTSETSGMYMQPQYPAVADTQNSLEGYMDLSGQIYTGNTDCFPRQPHFQ